jgi:hypothetical protein
LKRIIDGELNYLLHARREILEDLSLNAEVMQVVGDIEAEAI